MYTVHKKEFIMSAIASDFSVRPAGSGAYLANLGLAFGSLCKAVFAVTPQQAVAAAAVKIEARKPVSMLNLYRLACQSDSTNQALVDELRFIASRG